MKKIIKKILAICAFTVIIGGSLVASAAEEKAVSPRHVHQFQLVHVATREEYAGTHQYIWGYDKDGNPIYHFDCQLTNIIWTRIQQCTCGEQYGESVDSVVYIRHSVSH